MQSGIGLVFQARQNTLLGTRYQPAISWLYGTVIANIPMGSIGWFSQYTREQWPKSPCWYFSSCWNNNQTTLLQYKSNERQPISCMSVQNYTWPNCVCIITCAKLHKFNEQDATAMPLQFIMNFNFYLACNVFIPTKEKQVRFSHNNHINRNLSIRLKKS